MKYRVVFFGTPDFSVPSLDIIFQHVDFEVIAVVSMPDRPAGRGQKLKTPPVAEYAKQKGLKLFQSENVNKDQFLNQFLKTNEIDFYVVIAFAQFLGNDILNIPKHGAFNIHTSLLPKYRGAAPIQYALLNGDHTTGVSIQKMVKKMDAGDLVYSHDVVISPEDNSGTLFKKLEQESAIGLKTFLDLFMDKKGTLTFKSQEEDNVSFAPTIQKEDGLINPFTEDSIKIQNKLRAYTPWPGLFIYLNDMRLKVHTIEAFPKVLNPGDVDTQLGSLLIGTTKGTIRLSGVQPEGKKAQKDTDFLNGIKSKKIVLQLNKDKYE
ncbi:MAG: methionyl-tRNA formyltransferase [Bacteriovoracaceae bacterium]|nr:methionyl-tRNA formyltransferase [Bacteriovoracaceae bacterium]